MARIAGVTPQAVNGWFKKGVISKKSAIALAEAANVSVTWLLERKYLKIQASSQMRAKCYVCLGSYLRLNKRE
ncbi:helix-turn-helix domain-containing protein [Klebsiella variicola subsp. variicola]|nr:helix-turn-helix domain-containing protein [Klebsiella variicola subsp. variicola]